MATTEEELQEVFDRFADEHPCSVRQCTSPLREIKELDRDYFVTVCFFEHETMWAREELDAYGEVRE